jgi:hypothetical protein
VAPLPSSLTDHWGLTQILWGVKQSTGKYWLTPDFTGEFTAQGTNRRPPMKYLFLPSSSKALWRPNDDIVAVRSRRTHPLDALLGYGASIPKPGMGNLISEQRALVGALAHDSTSRDSAIVHGWSSGCGEDSFQEIPYTFATPNQTSKIYQCQTAGGYIGRWELTVPSIGVTSLNFLSRVDMGVGVNGYADAFQEANGLLHNPTFAGSGQGNIGLAPATAPDPWRPTPSPTVVVGRNGNLLYGMTVPLDFSAGNEFGQDHGGDISHSAIWHDLLHGFEVEVNCYGEGMHRMRSFTYYPWQYNSVTSGNDFQSSNGCFMADRVFDSLIWYDAVNDTEFDVGFSVGATNGWQWTCTQNIFLTQDAAHTPVSLVGSKIPSGIGGAIYRQNGLNVPNTQLAVGFFTNLSPGAVVGPGVIFNMSCNLSFGNWPVPANNYDTVMGAATWNQAAKRRQPGWLGCDYIMCTGTYTQVKAMMRSLAQRRIGNNVLFGPGAAPAWFS